MAAIDLRSLGTRALRARPAMEEIYLTVLDIVEEQFETQGRRGGEEWTPIDDVWLARKLREGRDPRILHSTGHLRASVTQYRHRSQYVRIEDHKIVFRSQTPYADVHQFGGARFGRPDIPKRQFVKFLKRDQQAFAKEILKHVTKQIKRRKPMPR
jgi:phage gpG-like protein